MTWKAGWQGKSDLIWDGGLQANSDLVDPAEQH
jgi:hypothetical protein